MVANRVISEDATLGGVGAVQAATPRRMMREGLKTFPAASKHSMRSLQFSVQGQDNSDKSGRIFGLFCPELLDGASEETFATEKRAADCSIHGPVGSGLILEADFVSERTGSAQQEPKHDYCRSNSALPVKSSAAGISVGVADSVPAAKAARPTLRPFLRFALNAGSGLGLAAVALSCPEFDLFIAVPAIAGSILFSTRAVLDLC